MSLNLMVLVGGALAAALAWWARRRPEAAASEVRGEAQVAELDVPAPEGWSTLTLRWQDGGALTTPGSIARAVADDATITRGSGVWRIVASDARVDGITASGATCEVLHLLEWRVTDAALGPPLQAAMAVWAANSTPLHLEAELTGQGTGTIPRLLGVVLEDGEHRMTLTPTRSA